MMVSGRVEMISLRRLTGAMVCALLFFCQVAISCAADESEGMIYPNEIVKVSSQVSGILEEVLVERGDIVTTGQVLARLKSGVEKASVELARANVAFLKRKAERNVELAKKRLISEHEHDELVNELKKAELQLEEAQERLKLRTITSTIDGVVTERLMAPGDYVGETPIMKLASLNPLRIEVIAPARRYGAIRKGMKAEIRPEAPVGGVYIGKVTIVDRVIDAASSTFGVRIELPNPKLKVPSGLRCRVRFL